MRIAPKTITLKKGKSVLLRSAEPEDAAAILEHLQITSAETELLSRYPEEYHTTVEEESAYLQYFLEDAENFLLTAWVDGKLAGIANLNRLRDLIKYRHRGEFGISIQKKYHNLGLGSVMTRISLYFASHLSFEQVELSVSSGNTAARHVYEKLGFRQVGTIPRAYRLKNGTYHDEILMVCDTRTPR